MNQRDLIETTYDDYDTQTLRNANQTLNTTYATDDSVGQTREQAEDQYTAIAETIRSELPSGEVLVDVAANATREQALSAVDLRTRYDGRLDCLVLDIDETLRTVECAENTLPVDVRTCLGAFWADGTPVVVAMSAANRDPRRWENPLELDVNRPKIRDHVAFGRGVHVCAGSPLARVETRVMLEDFLEKTSDISLDESIHGPKGNRNLEYDASFIIRGLTELHLKLTPR
jgi:hypothetical protein